MVFIFLKSINELKVIDDLYSQCLKGLSKMTYFMNMEGVLIQDSDFLSRKIRMLI